MAALRDKYYLNFRGGIRNDLSDYEKDATQVVKIINFDIDKPGLTRRRLGSVQVGPVINSSQWVENSTFFQRIVSASSPDPFFLVNENADAVIRKLVGSYNTTAVAVGDTSIILDDASGFPSSGSIEIDGDLATYSGKSTNTLTGVSGITSSHVVGSAVHTWVQISATTIDGTLGVSYAPLNNVLFIQGHYDNGGTYTWDGTTLTQVTDGDYPNSAFATTYRQRIFVQGGSGAFNTISFSDPGSPSSWDAANKFFVEDARMEPITGLRVLNDELLIFKPSSIFGYNEVNLKQRSNNVGSYNNKTHQEIGGLVYTFCPQGVFRSDGVNTKRISDPVKKWIDGFRPKPILALNTLIMNTCSAQYDGKFMIYLDQTLVDGVTYSDVVLVYDTIHLNWVVYTGFTNFKHMAGYNTFYYGGAKQTMKSLWGGNSVGQFFRFFSKTYVDADNNTRFNGASGELFSDLFSNTGVVISATLETKLDDLGVPYHKTVDYLRVFAQDKGFIISVRKEEDSGLSDWIPVGEVTKRNQLFRLPKGFEGYRFAVSVTHMDPNSAPILDGIGWEGIEITTTQRPNPKGTSVKTNG